MKFLRLGAAAMIAAASFLASSAQSVVTATLSAYPGASVTATSQTNGAVTNGVLTDTGRMSLQLAPSTTYAVAVTPAAGSTASAFSATITTGQRASADVSLQLIAAAQAAIVIPAGYYLGIVATRGTVPVLPNAGVNWVMARSGHTARAAIPLRGLRLMYGNYAVGNTNNFLEQSPGPVTFAVSVEYPAGVFYPCTWNGGAPQALVAPLADGYTDGCGPQIPDGAKFWIRTLETGASGTVHGYYGTSSTTDDGFDYGNGTPVSKLTSGTFTTGGQNLYLTPLAILGATNKPGVCIVGDSRAHGLLDSANDASDATGQVSRLIGSIYGYSKLAVPGDSETTFLASSAGRQRVFAYCTHLIDEFGIINLGSGIPAQTVANNRVTLESLPSLAGKIIFGTTLTPVTSSTDSYATVANQTITTDVRPFNAIIRAGLTTEQGVIDIAAVVDPMETGKWPVSAYGAASGTAQWATVDGTHETPTLNKYIALQLGHIISWFRR